jgi:hypothetical protein
VTLTQNPSDGADLRQADLSGLSLKEMTALQRAELKRRFEVFMKAYAGVPAAPRKPLKPTRKWVPGMKA